MSGEQAAGGAAAQKVFISYRREDSAAYAGRIYDAIVACFGEDNVFMDVELEPGVDFVERITEVVSGCAALVVVIGPNWASAADGDGTPRLHDPADFVRREVGAAIRRADVTVIPVLVNKATMPRAAELPEELQPLARRNALELSDGRWRYDVGRLTARLEELLAGLTGFTHLRPVTEEKPAAEGTGAALAHGTPATREAREAPAGRTEKTTAAGQARVTPGRLLIEGAVLAALAGWLGRWIGDGAPDQDGTAGVIAELVLQRLPIWGLLGLALAPWLGWRLGRTDLGYLAVLGLLLGLITGLLSGLAFALPHKLPDPRIPNDQQPGWGILSLAIAGAGIGALLGVVWRPRRLMIGLLGGLAGGVLGRLLLNATDPFSETTSGFALSFGILAALIALGALSSLLLRSRPAAKG